MKFTNVNEKFFYGALVFSNTDSHCALIEMTVLYQVADNNAFYIWEMPCEYLNMGQLPQTP